MTYRTGRAIFANLYPQPLCQGVKNLQYCCFITCPNASAIYEYEYCTHNQRGDLILNSQLAFIFQQIFHIFSSSYGSPSSSL